MKSLKPYIKKIKINHPKWKNQSRIIGEAIEHWAIDNLSCPKCHSDFCQHCYQSY